MRIASISLKNFRCFGPENVTIKLEDLTALVGANGTGKSAALGALARLFGTTQSDKRIVRSDFHLPADKSWEEVEQAQLRIEAVLEFPELSDADAKLSDPVAACFKHMTIESPKGPPYCRVRLDATWEQGNLPEGDVSESLVWVTSPLGTDAKDESIQAVQKHERNRIHVHYVPAARDPAKQIRQVSGSLLHTLLRAVHWSQGARETIAKAADSIRETFTAQDGVNEIQSVISKCWGELHGAPEHREVVIRPVAREVDEIIGQVEAIFRPGPADNDNGIESLSDGQRSLFYLAIVAALFEVQEKVGQSEIKALSKDKLAPPILNLLAVEEPENHVAPHYLGRIMKVLRDVSNSDRGQIVVSSHSASILARVEPKEVRHLRSRQPERTTIVSQIILPEGADEHKFVREAVRAYPELYFSSFVVLGEGDSEEIVLPRLAEAMGVQIDASFVSVVPLGGRHVNHFWRLLNQLGIPHVTLLDLDRERHGGGWSRIKYAIDQLIANGADRRKVLSVTDDKGKTSVMSDEELVGMHDWGIKGFGGLKQWKEAMLGWKTKLENFNVFFSAPLDLDYMMLHSFPDAYQVEPDDGDGPDIPDEDDEDFDEQVEAVCRAVLKGKEAKGESYTSEAKLSFFWYRYLFLGRSKPVTHISALARIEDKELVEKAPKVLIRMLNKMRAAIGTTADE